MKIAKYRVGRIGRGRPAAPALPRRRRWRGARCRNCGESLELETAPKFCPACGQETTLHPSSVWEFAHEFIGHYVALEGKLWKTLSLLMLHPGQLTREYLAGRRRRYVHPLRLYLSASFVFFVFAKLISPASAPYDAPIGNVVLPGSVASATVVGGAPGHVAAVAQPCDSNSAACNAIKRWFGPVIQRWRDHPQQAQRELQSRYAAGVPYAIFALLPLFAGLYQLAYRNRRMLYGEHLVFSLHMHAFCFIALLAVAWLPEAIGDLAAFVIPVYALLAMRRVYGGSWGATLIRALFIGVSYGFLLSVAVAAGMVYLFATAT